ncbi:HAMP domain-containing histidine kinase [Ammoniphilus sp. CFH 90114]|nr:HAMP domain-containing histidine kinase [Ammoniphilus sp. CFH 90114]
MLQYWTTRYVVTLIMGLVVIGILSTMWLKHNATEKRLDIMNLLAEEMVDRVVDTHGKLQIGQALPRIIERRQNFLDLDRKFLWFILDEKGRVIYQKFKTIPVEWLQNIRYSLEENDQGVRITTFNDERFLVVKRKIEFNNQAIGWVVLLNPEKDITSSPEDMQLLVTLLTSLALLGWGVIYLLTKKLSKPIQDVAMAAKQIVAGNYEVKLDKNIKEKEVYELVETFQDMTTRLQKLESMRTELLAGVTHELKTPVTSISGLLQAVKGEIVTGEEAKEFIDICHKETYRLEKMVEDLLNFNSIAIGEINVNKERHNANQFIQEIAHQWDLFQDHRISLNVTLPEHTIWVLTDSLRIQQILYNLLNNANQAIQSIGKMEMILYENNGEVKIDIKDNGMGIPSKEQSLIFERFYRGEGKKYKIRGLGLGLTISKMMAKALGGDLVLKESSMEGTTFTLILQKYES